MKNCLLWFKKKWISQSFYVFSNEDIKKMITANK